MRQPPSQPPPATAFTLVEALLSVAILTLLILVVTQLVNSATVVTTASRKRMDADNAARLVLDRMANDFAGLVKRKDVNYIFYKQPIDKTGTSNDAVFFYSEAPAYLSPSASGKPDSTSLVGYRINVANKSYSGIPVLERLGEKLTWDGQPDAGATKNTGGAVFLTYSGGLPLEASTIAGNWKYTLGTPPYSKPDDVDHFHLLSDQVFRIEFCFLLKSGTFAVPGTSIATTTTGYSNAPTAIPATISQPFVTSNYFNGATLPDLAGNVYGFPPDLTGIVVTIALLDTTSRKILAGSKLSEVAAKLEDSLSGTKTVGDVQNNPPLPAEVWQNKILTSNFAGTAGIPQAAASQIRIYQRTFYFNRP